MVGIQKGARQGLGLRAPPTRRIALLELRIGDQDIDLFKGCNVTKELVIEFSGVCSRRARRYREPSGVKVRPVCPESW